LSVNCAPEGNELCLERNTTWRTTMPTYEYECMECSHRFEVFQSIKDNPLDACVKCGGSVKKLISSGAGIIFKGSGFYVNDYKGAGKKSEAPCEPAAGSCSSCKGGDTCGQTQS
jgi:putative FmdB family regulatory protein